MKVRKNSARYKNLPQSYDPLLEENKILNFWTKNGTFQTIQDSRRREHDGFLSFHSGPPFPTGSPHSGHIANGIIKDIFTRYGWQKKLQVESQFGWDCHGLAVEHEVDKKLGIKTHEDLQSVSVAAYNAECRKFVQRHEAEWRNCFERIGNWVDFANTYPTMSKEFMEQVWGVFKRLYEKGLVSKETKVLPFSTGCFTHLSHFEAEQNWKDTTEVNATIAVSISNSSVKLLVWTSAPWTLLSNVAFCVNPNAIYVKVKMVTSGQHYILGKNRLPFVFENSFDYLVEEEIQGEGLSSLQCQALFGDPSETFAILTDESVRVDSGTGIVALSPYFDAVDYRVCAKNGILKGPNLCPVDDSGRFKESVPMVGGSHITEANGIVVECLQRLGQLLHLEEVKSKKPHCWRSDVPLISKLTSTWFLQIKDFERNRHANWINCSPTEGQRKGDWAFARNRYWGTPMPIWSSPSGDEIRCVGSIEELLKLTGVTSITDLHRENVDELRIPSVVPGNPPLCRVSEVFDCWFESGVAPLIGEASQADFIAEGVDQTLGWLYTTFILSNALARPPPAKNVFMHGLVLSQDGMKLSKRKHNHNDALHMAEKYGADAVRLHMASCPLVNGQNFILQEDGVRKMSSDVFDPIYTILRGLVPLFGKEGWVTYGIAVESGSISFDVFDRWILSQVESLLQFYDDELGSYRLHSVIPRIIKLIASVQEWYVPNMQRKIDPTERCPVVLFNVIFKLCLMLSPFAPFFTEHVFQVLRPFANTCFRRESIHDTLLTQRSPELISENLEIQVTRWQTVIELVRDLRTKHIIPIQYRIDELIVIHPSEKKFLADDEGLVETLTQITNVRHAIRSTCRSEIGAVLKARLKDVPALRNVTSSSELKEIDKKVQDFNDAELENIFVSGSVELDGHTIPLHDIQISYDFQKQLDEKHAVISKNELIIVIGMNRVLSYYEEGTYAAVISAVKKLRSKAKVYPSELATVCYSTKDQCLRHAFSKFKDDLRTSTNSMVKSMNDTFERNEEIFVDHLEIKGAPVMMQIFRNNNNLD